MSPPPRFRSAAHMSGNKKSIWNRLTPAQTKEALHTANPSGRHGPSTPHALPPHTCRVGDVDGKGAHHSRCRHAQRHGARHLSQGLHVEWERRGAIKACEKGMPNRRWHRAVLGFAMAT